jgi:hypothetical protein
MKRSIVHLSLNIAGALLNAKDLKGCISVDGKPLMTVREIKQFLSYQLSLGRRVLPMSDECEGFDYQTGCPGHEYDDGEE